MTGGRATARVIGLAMVSVGVAQGFARFAYALLLPAMKSDVLGSYGRAGWLGTGNLAGYLVGMVVLSLLVHRVRPTVVIRAGLAGTFAGIVVVAVAPGFWVLLVGMCVSGVASAGVWVPFAGIVTSAVPRHRRGLAMGLVVTGFGLSIVATGALTAVCQYWLGARSWRPVWGIGAVGCLLVLAAVVRWLPAEADRADATARIGLATLRTVPGWRGMTASYASYGLGYVLYTTFLAAALQHDAGLSASGSAAVYSLLGLTGIAGGILIGRVSDMIGRRRALMLAMPALAVCAAAVPIAGQPWLSLSAAVFGVLLTGVGAVVAAHIGDYLPARGVAAAFGAVTVSFGAMQAVGPSLGGWVADRTGSFTVTFALAAAAFAVATIAARTMPAVPRSGAASQVPVRPAVEEPAP